MMLRARSSYAPGRHCSFTVAGEKQRKSSDHRQPRSTQPAGGRLPPHQALLILTQPGAQNSCREQEFYKEFDFIDI